MYKHSTNLLFLTILLLSSATIGLSQKVTVKATTDKKEVAAILANDREKNRANKSYFDEDEKCRSLLKARDWRGAETSCSRAVSLVEKLPAEHVLERSSSRADLAIALLEQGKPNEAILLLEKSVEIRIPRAGEADADTADLYFLLGGAYGLLSDVPTARSFYEKAENSYRAAFKEIGEDGDDIRFSYPRRMKRALQAHFELVKSAGLTEETEVLRARLADCEKTFAKYLN